MGRCPLFTIESLDCMRNEKLEMRNVGAAHKNKEAPRVYILAMPEDGISVTSHKSLVTPDP